MFVLVCFNHQVDTMRVNEEEIFTGTTFCKKKCNSFETHSYNIGTLILEPLVNMSK